MAVLSVVLRLVLLMNLIVLAVSLWFMEAVVATLARHRRVIVGQAMGAGAVVIWWADAMLALLAAAKRPISHYIFTNHPRLYQNLRNILIPRRR